LSLWFNCSPGFGNWVRWWGSLRTGVFNVTDKLCCWHRCKTHRTRIMLWVIPRPWQSSRFFDRHFRCCCLFGWHLSSSVTNLSVFLHQCLIHHILLCFLQGTYQFVFWLLWRFVRAFLLPLVGILVWNIQSLSVWADTCISLWNCHWICTLGFWINAQWQWHATVMEYINDLSAPSRHDP
jgi:hypothetical protein